MILGHYSQVSEEFKAKFGAFASTLKPAISLRGNGPNQGSRDDVVKRIREDLKAAQKAGVLPAFCKFSVRKPDYNSIHVDLVQWEGRVFSDEYTELLMAKLSKSTIQSRYVEDDFERTRYGTGRLPKLVPALTEVQEAIRALSNRHNYDNSDIQTDYFDVGYYLHASVRDIEDVAERAIRLECDVDFQALHARAVAAIASLHPDCRDKIIASECGRGGFEMCGEWAMGGIIKVAERAAGRPMSYDKRARGWRVVKDEATEAAHG